MLVPGLALFFGITGAAVNVWLAIDIADGDRPCGCAYPLAIAPVLIGAPCRPHLRDAR